MLSSVLLSAQPRSRRTINSSPWSTQNHAAGPAEKKIERKRRREEIEK
jgi:hypothetical protein